MQTPGAPRKGRGVNSNPANRFFPTRSEAADDGWNTEPDPLPPLQTTVTIQRSRTIISRNQSPDIPFTMSINPYQGCEHGCVYCYARPSHAYLDLSPGLDFETRLFAKPNAAALLRHELAKPGHQVSTINIGANTDPYQPIEREWKITRSLLEVLREVRHPVALITKNAMILRDLDLLGELARQNLVQVFVSVTSLDPELSRVLEPRASAPHRRLQTIERLSAAGIPVGVMVAPLIPFINDAELERILEKAAAAGAQRAGYVFLRLPHELKDLFRDWLQTHAPLKAARVMAAIRASRGGSDNNSAYGQRMTGEGPLVDLLRQRFAVAVRRYGLNPPRSGGLRTDLFRPPRADGQLSLFDD
ncbi:DNA repair photolyase [Fluviicoccus keumensis]|uniref:DNA repair photolyase n=1 Tax=Fluviicoccus keumensis TaxID=1435465 RepID=A0A4Q7YJX1_9GAMM|nr:PA0069 family radical SAM protein [Fluviicoccus keumensis]RZU36931.1 DNA repair photolyase [Fluviicoccus keumensis]